MRKIFAIFVSFALFVTANSVWAISIPSYYSQHASNGAVTTYKHNSENIYAIVVKTANADISFAGNLGSAGSDTYYKGSITDHWNQNSNAVAVVNGQFYDIMGSWWKYFTTDPARLVFPVKSDYSSLSTGVYDNNFALRSLLINSSGKAYIREGFSQVLFNSSNIKEYIVGLYPSAVKDPDSAIGRNYIGGLPKSGCDPRYSTCENEYLIFFIATGTTHYNMLHQMSLWSIPAKSRIMMDGSGSAQMYLKTGSSGIVIKGDDRKIPNSIVISNK